MVRVFATDRELYSQPQYSENQTSDSRGGKVCALWLLLPNDVDLATSVHTRTFKCPYQIKGDVETFPYIAICFHPEP